MRRIRDIFNQGALQVTILRKVSRCIAFSRKWTGNHFYMAKWTLIYLIDFCSSMCATPTLLPWMVCCLHETGCQLAPSRDWQDSLHRLILHWCSQGKCSAIHRSIVRWVTLVEGSVKVTVNNKINDNDQAGQLHHFQRRDTASRLPRGPSTGKLSTVPPWSCGLLVMMPGPSITWK